MLGPFVWDEPINSLLGSAQGLFTCLMHETKEDPLSHCIQSPALRYLTTLSQIFTFHFI